MPSDSKQRQRPEDEVHGGLQELKGDKNRQAHPLAGRQPFLSAGYAVGYVPQWTAALPI